MTLHERTGKTLRRQRMTAFCFFLVLYYATALVLLGLARYLPIVAGEIGWILFLLMGVCGLAQGVIGLRKTYLAWKIIQPLRLTDSSEVNMPTPGKAVGFLFIPIFHLYWIFVAFVGLANRSRKFYKIHQIKDRPMSSGLAIGLCVFILIFPLLFFSGPLMFFVLFCIYVSDVNRFLNTSREHLSL